jgi:hypothetical protein
VGPAWVWALRKPWSDDPCIAGKSRDAWGNFVFRNLVDPREFEPLTYSGRLGSPSGMVRRHQATNELHPAMPVLVHLSGQFRRPGNMNMLRPSAAALDYTNGRGVLHRDVKPSSVVLSEDKVPFRQRPLASLGAASHGRIPGLCLDAHR